MLHVRAVWGVRKWCWLPNSGVSQAYSNTWPRAGVSLFKHLAQLSVSKPVPTPFNRWKRNPAETHTGRGIGVYSNFTCFDVVAGKGHSFPKKDNIKIQNPFTIFLNGFGGIKNVLHEGEKKIGDAVTADSKLARGWLGFGN